MTTFRAPEPEERKSKREAQEDELLTWTQAQVDAWIDANIDGTAQGLTNLRRALKVLSRGVRYSLKD